MLMRTHVILPAELVKEVDRVVGARRRSRFVEEAIREHLRREALSSALAESAGILKEEDYPEWDSPEKVSSWVRECRGEDEARLARKLKPSEG
jgi:predicted transcriptional regulator